MRTTTKDDGAGGFQARIPARRGRIALHDGDGRGKGKTFAGPGHGLLQWPQAKQEQPVAI